ncbi:MAG: hypothetical protein Q7R52_02615 [archaeon]|nr:hypothetical protein [archaeon]
MSYNTLKEFNTEGILTNLLAAEEHDLGTSSGMDTWCKQKHFKHIGFGHHMKELLQISQGEDPRLYDKLKNVADKWRKMIDEGGYTASEIRDLRNEFREAINDETLSQSKEKCGVCALDRRNGSTFALSTTSGDSDGSNAALWIVGGIIVVGLIVLIANSRR